MFTASSPEDKVRASIVDGIFYPSRRRELAALVQQLWQESTVPIGQAAAIIAPHAAFQYSGDLAAAAFRAASARRIQTAVLLGPVHRDPSDQIILPESGYFQTPLGNIPVNRRMVERLLGCGTRFVRNDIPHLEEHCLEVQIPFIQFLFPGADIVPILLGLSTAASVKLLANALQITFGRLVSSTLFVVSANMTSFRPSSPPEADNPSLLLELIQRRDPQGILAAAERGEVSTCGAGCIATLLTLSSLAESRIELLGRKSSAEVAKDRQNVVHYAAISLQENETSEF